MRARDQDPKKEGNTEPDFANLNGKKAEQQAPSTNKSGKKKERRRRRGSPYFA